MVFFLTFLTGPITFVTNSLTMVALISVGVFSYAVFKNFKYRLSLLECLGGF